MFWRYSMKESLFHRRRNCIWWPENPWEWSRTQVPTRIEWLDHRSTGMLAVTKDNLCPSKVKQNGRTRQWQVHHMSVLQVLPFK